MLSLPIGISDFREIIEKQCDYVDKTLFIRDILEDRAKTILLTRPRRFGKTLNMMMLKYFLDLREDNQPLFQHLNIEKEKTLCQQYQNQYPVIYLTLKDIKELSYERMYGMFQLLIAGLYGEHDYLLETLKPKEQELFNRYLARETSPDENKQSLRFLSHVLSRHYNKKVFILIDEYDTPIHASYMENYYKEGMDFMRGFFGAALKDNVALEKCVMTGILRIAQESIFSDLNNVKVYTVLSEQYGSFFGFTQEEVETLLKKAGLFDQWIREWLTQDPASTSYDIFLKALTTGDIEEFSYRLQQYLTHSVSFFELNKNAEEVRYPIFILGLVAGLQGRYDIKSNCPVGRGRCDILLLPKDKNAIGIVMELKRTSDENLLEKTAQEALTQIESNQYIAELIQRGIKTILKLGFAFAGREVKILWK